MQKYGFTGTVFVTSDSSTEVFDPYRSFDSPLTRVQIKELAENGFSIQSHCVTHRPMTELLEEEIKRELVESKNQIEEITKKPVDFLAMPGGFYNKVVKKIAKEVGYKAVIHNAKGTNNAKSDLYALRRIPVERDFNLSDFASSFGRLAACQWRIMGRIKELPGLILGPSRGVQLRNWLQHTRLGYFTTFRGIRITSIIFFLLILIIAAIIVVINMF
jgi:peptidoglycan/xylan/chitin deacetylase (PgdA/CDA1 family)